MLTNTENFWNKEYTKQWLANNTTFKYPKTVSLVGNFTPILNSLESLPVGSWVLKPNTGRKSTGVVLFSKTCSGYLLFPEKIERDLEDFKIVLVKTTHERIQTAKQFRNHTRWFIEEWVHPHEQLHIFTSDMLCPPIFRLCGRPKIHFIGMSLMREKETGLSAAGWQVRKYIWLDLEGNVRLPADFNLKNVDAPSIQIMKNKSIDNPPVGLKIEGLANVVNQINKEIAPKIRLYRNLSWSCDGTFNTNNEFVIIEMNHSPGPQFRGFSWEN